MKHFRLVSYHVAFLIFVVPVLMLSHPLGLVSQLLTAIAQGLGSLLQSVFFDVDLAEERQHQESEKRLAEFLAQELERQQQTAKQEQQQQPPEDPQ